MFSPRLGRVGIQARAGAADAVQRARCRHRPWHAASCTSRTSASVSRSGVPGGSFTVISKRSCASCGIRSVPSVGTRRHAPARTRCAATASTSVGLASALGSMRMIERRGARRTGAITSSPTLRRTGTDDVGQATRHARTTSHADAEAHVRGNAHADAAARRPPRLLPTRPSAASPDAALRPGTPAAPCPSATTASGSGSATRPARSASRSTPSAPGPEQLAGDALDEHQRQEHRDRGQGRRDHGHADFAGAGDRGLAGRPGRARAPWRCFPAPRWSRRPPCRSPAPGRPATSR